MYILYIRLSAFFFAFFLKTNKKIKMNFIKKLETAVYNLFHGLENWLQKVVIPVSIVATNFLKSVLWVDKLDVIGLLAESLGLHGGKDLEDKLRVIVPMIIKDLPIAQKYLALGNDNMIVAAVYGELKTLSPNIQSLFHINLSALIATEMSGGKMPVQDSLLAVQSAYKNDPEPKPETIQFESVPLPEDTTTTETGTIPNVSPAASAMTAEGMVSPIVDPLESNNGTPADPVAPAVVAPIEETKAAYKVGELSYLNH